MTLQLLKQMGASWDSIVTYHSAWTILAPEIPVPDAYEVLKYTNPHRTMITAYTVKGQGGEGGLDYEFRMEYHNGFKYRFWFNLGSYKKGGLSRFDSLYNMQFSGVGELDQRIEEILYILKDYGFYMDGGEVG